MKTNNNYLELAKLYPKLSRQMQRNITRNIDKDLLNCICEICLNIIKSNVTMSTLQKQKLSRYKNIVRSLSNRNKNFSAKKKIIQRGGSFLPLLFSIAAPMISKLLFSRK